MKFIILFAALLAIALCHPDEQCSAMNRDVCKETNRCKWLPGDCRVSVNDCNGVRRNICNATRKCFPPFLPTTLRPPIPGNLSEH